eukprot:984361-Lingulodinium_polyedra.AAC.1
MSRRSERAGSVQFSIGFAHCARPPTVARSPWPSPAFANREGFTTATRARCGRRFLVCQGDGRSVSNGRASVLLAEFGDAVGYMPRDIAP